jgi:phage terminase large subunit
MLYTPNDKQAIFHESPTVYRLYGGARGGGKSHAIRIEAIRQMVSHPGINGLLLRRTYKQAEQSFIKPLLKDLPKNKYQYNATKRELYINGGTLYLGYLDKTNDVEQYQGMEYDFIGIDELTHFKEEDFDALLGSLRSTKLWEPNLFASANPGGIGHDWVKRRWIDRQFKEGEDPRDYSFTPAKVYDNPELLKNERYVKRLQALPTMLRRAWLEGDWDIFVGQFFPEWRRNLHLIPYWLPPAEWRKFICLDYGYAAPSCALWIAISPTGQLVAYRELYITGKTYSELGDEMRRLTPANEQIEYLVADPAIFGKSPGGQHHSGESGAETLSKKGFRMRRADNSRTLGWMRVREYLRVDDKIVRPMLLVTQACQNLIRTLPALVYDTHNPEDCDTAGEDHAPDALRYGVMSRPGVTELPSEDPNLRLTTTERHLKEEKERIAREREAQESGGRDFWND